MSTKEATSRPERSGSLATQDRPTLATVARSLLSGYHGHSVEAMGGPQLDIARLTAGMNPNRVDRSASAFAFGAYEAFSAVYQTMSEELLSLSTREMLRRRAVARLLLTIEEPGSRQVELSDRLDVQPSNLSTLIRELRDADLNTPIKLTITEVADGRSLAAWLPLGLRRELVTALQSFDPAENYKGPG